MKAARLAMAEAPVNRAPGGRKKNKPISIGNGLNRIPDFLSQAK
jgi:hypothetical protein